MQKTIFKFQQCISPISSPIEKRSGHPFEERRNRFTLKYYVPILVEIDPVFLEEKISNFRQCFSLLVFRHHLPLDKDRILQMNTLEFPSPKNDLY